MRLALMMPISRKAPSLIRPTVKIKFRTASPPLRVNPDFKKQLEEKGIIFSCQSPDGKLVEIAELRKV